jgi:microcystin-dependent protein
MEGTIGEIRLFAAPFAPKNWSYCNGALVAIRSNTALFSILGTTYGGDGQNTFALPSLGGRSAISSGQGPGLTYRVLGEMAGMPSLTLTNANLAMHTHTTTTSVAPPAYSEEGNAPSASNAIPASKAGAYSADNDSNLRPFPASITADVSGGSQPFPIMQPTLGMNYIICMYGLFPQRS